MGTPTSLQGEIKKIKKNYLDTPSFWSYKETRNTHSTNVPIVQMYLESLCVNSNRQRQTCNSGLCCSCIGKQLC